MPGRTYNVYTNLPPGQLQDVAAVFYFTWLAFAIGKTDIGGKRLKHPSGRYAAALRVEKRGDNLISIIADDDAEPQVGIIEEGHPAFSLKDRMLASPKAKMSKAGYLYRVLYLRPDQQGEPPATMLDKVVTENDAMNIPKIWARPRPFVDPNSRGPFTMSNKPGSSPWRIPAMVAYSPAAILAAEIRRAYGKR
jgi:hypothetical protein